MTTEANASEPVLWGIHGGHGGHADGLFKEESVVALSWSKLPDLASLEPDREAFKEAYRHAYPDAKEGTVVAHASQLFRFTHEAKAGDLVAYPAKLDRAIHLGQVEGPYRYVQDASNGSVHQRPVRWLEVVPRTRYSQGALYEMGSLLAFFQIKNYLDEHLALLRGQEVAYEGDEDATIAIVAEDIEDTTRDFVIKTLARELRGHPFASFVGHLLGALGYHVRVAPPGPDGGVDIVAHRDELGFEPPIVKAQVKSTEGTIGAPDVQALFGNVEAGEFGLFVTLGAFTKQATAFARGKSNLRLIDGAELTTLVLAHYDQLDARYKGLLPLKRVYVPESVDASDV